LIIIIIIITSPPFIIINNNNDDNNNNNNKCFDSTNFGDGAALQRCSVAGQSLATNCMVRVWYSHTHFCIFIVKLTREHEFNRLIMIMKNNNDINQLLTINVNSTMKKL